MNTFRFALLALLALTVSACDSGVVVEDTPSDAVLYVGNAGNFSDNNGSLTRYVLADSAVTQDAVPNLGGGVQNVYAEGSRVYVLLNFSDSFTSNRGRIDVLDAVSNTRTQQIDVNTPRALGGTSFIGGFGTAEAYATNLYSNTVTSVNLIGGTVGETLDVGPNPEGAVNAGGKVYVANSGFGAGTTVSVIEFGRVSTIEDVCAGPRTLLRDADGEVWVVCTGASDFSTGAVTAPGQVVVLDARSGAVRQRFRFEDETLGSATFGQDGVAVGGERPEIYVITGDGVVRFDTAANTQGARIRVAGAPVGAVAYDTAADRLYLGRPDADNPFTADGQVTIHDRGGAQVGQFRAGVAPVALAFASTREVVEG